MMLSYKAAVLQYVVSYSYGSAVAFSGAFYLSDVRQYGVVRLQS